MTHAIPPKYDPNHPNHDPKAVKAATAWATTSGLIVNTEVWAETNEGAFYIQLDSGGLYAVPIAHQTRITQLNIAYANKIRCQITYDPGDTSLGAPKVVGGSYSLG